MTFNKIKESANFDFVCPRQVTSFLQFHVHKNINHVNNSSVSI